MNVGSRVFVRSRLVWLAWYPLRGRRCSVQHDPQRLGIGVGPLYLGLGSGVPTP